MQQCVQHEACMRVYLIIEDGTDLT
eukprot:SAG31_NODE_9326_length_1297_cov_1.329716_3_plen_24_part_01